jgi:anti-anti-sigma regulatory factor
MAMIADWLKIDGENVGHALREARGKLSDADGEMVLDFSSVKRIDAQAISALEELGTAAKEKSVKVVLRGVNVSIYKVLKLSRLTTEFSFLN